MNKRVMLTFDAIAYGNLEHMRRTGGFHTDAELVREALVMRMVMQKQFDQGFTQVIVRDPDSNRERAIDLGMD